MGLIAVPSMLKRGYDRKLALGCVMGGGALGQLIPPSLLFILYGFLANESVGRLFASGFVPGTRGRTGSRFMKPPPRRTPT